MEKKKKLCYYDFRDTTMYACKADQRFSYCAYVPEAYDENGDDYYKLVVLIHGTERRAQNYRDNFIDFAEKYHCIVLAPLFPAGIIEEGELDSYKFIKFHGIRFDHILLSMIDEMNEKYRIYPDKFMLHGFSGGGHFVHRFYYLHPERLSALSIGAPGMITYLDENYPWHVGISDFEEQFGQSIDFEQLRKVKVQMVVGDQDVETWEINVKDGPLWMDGVDKYGENRIQRLTGLKENYISKGISVRFDLVPGVNHNGWGILDAVKDFFAQVIEEEKEV
ncbi:MAG: hypothetical protein ACOX4S_03125 [Anaerovoracaceae bacterium]|jgi:hypothetical protein